MWDKARVQVLKQGIQSPDAMTSFFPSLGSRRNVAIMPASLSFQTDPKSHLNPSRDLQDFFFNDDYVFRQFLYACSKWGVVQPDTVYLAKSCLFHFRWICELGTLWKNCAHDKMHQLERSISNLTFQQHTYLRELRKFLTSLQLVNKALASFISLVLRVFR